MRSFGISVAATIVAIYKILQEIGQINHLTGLILVYGGTTIPFNAWLMRGYFDTIPRDLEESAYIDGATSWQAFTKIALPLAMPMVAVIFIFNLIAFWRGMGYDMLRFEVALPFPGSSRVTGNTASGSNRAWADESGGRIGSWQDFDRYAFPRSAAPVNKQSTRMLLEPNAK